jgi:GNAT superfamily N-acetyltransferase
VFRPFPYGDPLVQWLIGEIYADQTTRYGGQDATVIDDREFEPPQGIFLTAWQDGVLAGCAAWRAHGEDAELKRMYTVPAARRRGVAAALLAEIEMSARAAGKRRVILETGEKQPEAIALYEKCGYIRIEDFGFYKDYPMARCYGRVLERS